MSLPGQECTCDNQISIVTSSRFVELETYDQLLSKLLGVQQFLSCSLFPRAFNTRFNVLLDKLSEAGRTLPYVPPSEEVVQAVDKFVKLVIANKDGIVTSTRLGLTELGRSISS